MPKQELDERRVISVKRDASGALAHRPQAGHCPDSVRDHGSLWLVARVLDRIRTPSLEGEDPRVFLRARLEVFARKCGVFTIALSLLLTLLVVPRDGLAGFFTPSLLVTEGTGVVLMLLGFASTRAPLGYGVLEFLDGLLIFTACVGFDLAVFMGPRWREPELTIALIFTHMLLGRAAAVPSTGRRSAIVGVLSLLPIIIAADVIRRRTNGGDTFAWDAVIYWGVIAIVSSSLTSRRLYSMQRQVEDARRLGQYTLEQKIGEGGMGEVFRARHALLLRPTAVKLLPRARAGARAVERFEREVQMTSRLTHPSTIQIYDYGRAEDGTFYYAMEFLEGVTLEELVLRDGAQRAGRVVHILADVCASLAEAHDAGLVHRDIKAQNVMLCARGGAYDVVKVLDFGLVKTVDEEAHEGESLAGTPAYMAPEAIAHPEQFDARSDLYAVGALGYFLLAGAPVFVGNSAFELLGQHLHAPPMPPSERAARDIPAELERLVLACLAKSPHERPASARALRAELLALEDMLRAWTDEDAARWWSEHPTRDAAAGEPHHTRVIVRRPADVAG